MWLFGSGKKRKSASEWDLDNPLCYLSKSDPFTVRQALEGVLGTGATGSGKSSGGGKCLGKSYLAAGFGGLVLTAKSDERALWESYCRETGRSDDLLIFSPRENLRFNFLDYELNRKGDGAGLTENHVGLFAEVMEVADRQSSQGGGDSEPYWRKAQLQLVRNAVDLLVMAKNRLSIPELYRVVVSAASSLEQVRSEEWKKASYCFRCLAEADARPKKEWQKHDFEIVADYWMLEYPALSEKTRSVIVSSFTSTIDVLNRGLLRELFCTETNVTPDAAAAGKILLFDLPVKEYGNVGQIGQVIAKLCFQKSIERRNIAENPRPVFLWADEAQYFVTSKDMQFQTTCRSARVATVFLTQNISNFYAALGGNDKGKAEADSLFANLNTKIFHANGDPVTNDWAAAIIGRSRQFFSNSSSSYEPQDWLSQATGWRGPARDSVGVSETMEFEVPPRAFTTLRKGGPANDWLVDAIVFQGGRRFRQSGKTWLATSFSQRG